MEKDITIIICCYNGAQRISHVLDNIYGQKAGKQFIKEILFVDNHSTDNTRKTIDAYKRRELPFPLKYLYEETPGLSNARKTGVYACCTSWIAFLDDDNFVDPDWIIHIANYIDRHPQVGVFNGAVIPYVPFKTAADEEMKLKASLKVLACTHYSRENLKRKPFSPFRNPIGAGMVIRTEPLKALSHAGWLNSAGRTKDALTSGEDGEMAFYVKKQGYDFGFCPHAVLYHEISKKRLEDQYLKKIWHEMGKGVAIVAKKRDTGMIKDICYRTILIGRVIVYTIENKYKGKYYLNFIRGYFQEMKNK